MHDAVKRFQESDSDFSHSLEILFCFLAIVLLQCSEQQPFSYSVILWKWMNSQVEGKTKMTYIQQTVPQRYTPWFMLFQLSVLHRTLWKWSSRQQR